MYLLNKQEGEFFESREDLAALKKDWTWPLILMMKILRNNKKKHNGKYIPWPQEGNKADFRGHWMSMCCRHLDNLGISGRLWVCLSIPGCPWASVGVHWHPSASMGVHGPPRASQGVFGCLCGVWRPLGDFRGLWMALGDFGDLLKLNLLKIRHFSVLMQEFLDSHTEWDFPVFSCRMRLVGFFFILNETFCPKHLSTNIQKKITKTASLRAHSQSNMTIISIKNNSLNNVVVQNVYFQMQSLAE